MKTIKGNIVTMGLDGDFDVIVQGCNCFNTMGAGLAKEIATRIPAAFVEDRRTDPGDPKKLGKFSYCMVESKVPGQILYVINAYTQYHYRGRKNADYEAIRSAFRGIKNMFPQKMFKIAGT